MCHDDMYNNLLLKPSVSSSSLLLYLELQKVEILHFINWLPRVTFLYKSQSL